ncbi:MAG: YcjX family protein [Hyphomicrobium sp.]
MADLSTSDFLRSAQSRIGDYLTPSIRLGVTGLARSGKTIFITALARNLVSGGRLPFFTPDAEGRIVRAYLEPQPDDSVPRFDYEQHLGDLAADPPRWPESTRRISELRVTIEYRSDSRLKRALGLSKLHLDIVDYPGEWLIDLPLLGQDYRQFSTESLQLAHGPERSGAAKRFLEFLAGTDPAGPDDEQIALTGAKLFTDYLAQLRSSGAPATLAPGRLLHPGDLEGSPLLTYFPMPLASEARPPRGSLAAMMARRFESYKAEVVRPFFDKHFARLDRQIVLVDLLGAMDQGASAVADLERAIRGVMLAFRPGANTWLSAILGGRIDRVLFAATKADHLPAASHDRLDGILKLVVEAASSRAETAGAEVRTIDIAALRATRESTVTTGGETLPCLIGAPMAGEKIGRETFDGKREAAIFPGDLPADPSAALNAARSAKAGSLSLVRFEPPRLPSLTSDTKGVALPHIRLDRALEFLISDYLA